MRRAALQILVMVQLIVDVLFEFQANCDPYTVTDVMVRTTCLGEVGAINLEYK